MFGWVIVYNQQWTAPGEQTGKGLVKKERGHKRRREEDTFGGCTEQQPGVAVSSLGRTGPCSTSHCVSALRLLVAPLITLLMDLRHLLHLSFHNPPHILPICIFLTHLCFLSLGAAGRERRDSQRLLFQCRRTEEKRQMTAKSPRGTLARGGGRRKWLEGEQGRGGDVPTLRRGSVLMTLMS